MIIVDLELAYTIDKLHISDQGLLQVKYKYMTFISVVRGNLCRNL